MKIGIDYGGTITAAPEFFAVLTTAMVAAGHEVHIVTASPSRRHVESSLSMFEVVYTDIWLPDDCFVSIPEWKAELSKKIGLAIFIDDDPANFTGSSREMIGLRIYSENT